MADCYVYLVQLRQAERLLRDLYTVLAKKGVGWLTSEERQLLDSCDHYFSSPDPPPPTHDDDRWVDYDAWVLE